MMKAGVAARGPFHTVDRTLFVDLLRGMAAPDGLLVEQSPEGLQKIGEEGECITETHDFYAVFATLDEYRIVYGSPTLGTKPIDQTIAPGQTIWFTLGLWPQLDERWGSQQIDCFPPSIDHRLAHDALSRQTRLGCLTAGRLQCDPRLCPRGLSLPAFPSSGSSIS